MRFFPILLLSLTTVVALAQQAPQYVNAKQAQALLKKSPEIIVLDVRTPTEYKQGHVANAQNIDFRNPAFAQQVATLDKKKPTSCIALWGLTGGEADGRCGFSIVSALKILFTLMGVWMRGKKPACP